jgi:membrane protein HdeD
MAIAPARSPILTLEAVLLIVLGIAALILPLLAGAIVGTVIGVVLLISGAVGLASAFSGGPHVHQGWSIASAVIALLAGLLILVNPIAGAAGLVLLFGIYLVLDGVALIGLGLDQRKRGSTRWGLLLASGVVDILLAVLLLGLGAVGATAVVGFVLGVDLVFAGAALLMVHRTPLVGGAATPAI